MGGGRKAESHGWSALGSKADLGTKEVIQADLKDKLRLSLSLEQGEAHVPAWGFIAGYDCITGEGVVTGIKARCIDHAPSPRQAESDTAIDEVDVGVPAKATIERETQEGKGLERQAGIGSIEPPLVISVGRVAAQGEPRGELHPCF